MYQREILYEGNPRIVWTQEFVDMNGNPRLINHFVKPEIIDVEYTEEVIQETELATVDESVTEEPT